MKIVIAPDSFKGNLSAMEVARAVERGIRRVLPEADCIKVPMADGGEGTVRSLVAAAGGRLVRKKVWGPAGRRVQAEYGLIANGTTAVIEMASASGLPLVKGRARNPMKTSSFGTGELIRDALEKGAREIVIGIGGSATNDAGAGMAQALGIRFYDGRGRLIRERAGGGMLDRIARIDTSDLDPRIARTRITVACDVDNPLTGARGASRIYGPQKGATPAMVKRLDANLLAFGKLVRRDLGRDIRRLPGAGAAGGMGGGLVAFADAELKRGIDIVIEAAGLEQRIRGADLVITGEGRVDSQTPFGKTPAGVARVARKCGVPVVAIGGSLADDAHRVFAHGIDGLAAAINRDMALTEALGSARRFIADAAERVMRLILIGRGMS